jgi:hypothetical protein
MIIYDINITASLEAEVEAEVANLVKRIVDLKKNKESFQPATRWEISKIKSRNHVLQ